MWALIKGLPPDAAVRRGGKSWTQQDELIATLIERSDMWGRVLAIGQGRKPQDVPALPPVKHPDRPTGDGKPARREARRLSIAEFERQYGREVTPRGQDRDRLDRGSA